MKKLFIINDTSGTAAQYGIGTFIQELSDSLEGKNFQVMTVDVNSDSPAIETGENGRGSHWRFPKTKIKWDSENYHYYRNIAYCLAASVNGEDEVAFQFNYLHHGILSSVLKDLLPAARQVLTIHYGEGELGEKECAFFHTVDAVVTLCEETRRLLCDAGIADKVCLIVNGIKDRNLATDRDNRQRDSLRMKYGLTEDDKLILSVGRLCDSKGIGVLLEAVKPLIDRDSNIHLYLAGSGNEGNYRKSCTGYWKNVHFLGQMDRETVFELYQVADVGAFPSFQEQFGYVAPEMMMFGLPVVAYAQGGGLKDIFQWEGICQYAVSVNDAPELTRKLEWALMRGKKDSAMFRECFLQHYRNDNLKDYWKLYFKE